MRLLVKLLLALLLVVIGLVIAAMLYADALAKRAIERAGTYALGVETTLEDADVGIMSGTFSLDVLEVANPAGFDHPHFLKLDHGGMAVSLGTLRKAMVELPMLELGGIDMSLQRQAGGDTNYDVILASLQRFESGGKPSPDDRDGKRFLIRKLVVTDVDVHVDLVPQAGELTRLRVPIERIELTDIGSETDRGVLISELSSILIKALIAAVIEKGGGLIPADLLGDLRTQLAQLESLEAMGVEMVAEVQARVTEEVGRMTEDLTEQAQDAIDDATREVTDRIDKGLGNLLGGDQDD